MRRLLLPLLATLALPAAADAASVKISPKAVAVSASGVASVEAANPNRYALRGTAAVSVRGKTVASRSVKLARRSVGVIKVKLNAKALDAVRGAGGRATIALKLRRAGAKRSSTARRKLTLALPAGGPQAAPAPAPAPAPPSNRWVGRMGAEGGYDDFELTLDNGLLTFTKPPTVPVMCLENGGSYRSALSLEIFDAPGPWTVGTDGEVKKEGISPNQLVGSSARGITYKATETAATAEKVTGKLSMTFFESKYDVFSNAITFINCTGSQSFEAIPAP